MFFTELRMQITMQRNALVVEETCMHSLVLKGSRIEHFHNTEVCIY
jgi:hypothetical protein